MWQHYKDMIKHRTALNLYFWHCRTQPKSRKYSIQHSIFLVHKGDISSLHNVWRSPYFLTISHQYVMNNFKTAPKWWEKRLGLMFLVSVSAVLDIFTQIWVCKLEKQNFYSGILFFDKCEMPAPMCRDFGEKIPKRNDMRSSPTKSRIKWAYTG